MTRVRGWLFPGLIVGPVLLVVALSRCGVPLAVAALPAIVVSMVVIAILERVFPRDPAVDLFSDPQAPRDAVHGLLTGVVGSSIGSVTAVALLAAVFGDGDGLGWWPTGGPFVAQVAGAWLLYTFGDYWKHRAYHSVDALWWVHAMHHDVTGMHVLKGARLHFLEGTVRAGVVALPLLALGVPGEVLVWATTLESLLGNLNHSNLDQRLAKWLHWLVPTVDLHHIHHAVDRSLHDTNLGTPLFDLAFGTYTPPAVAPRPVIGIAQPIVPATLAGQLLFPFRQWRRRGAGRSVGASA